MVLSVLDSMKQLVDQTFKSGAVVCF